MIRDNGGFDRFKMIEVEKYPCKDKREAERRENEIMKELKASMNTLKSFLTEKERKEYRNEYLETNKDILKEYSKDYYKNNKDILKEYNKEYYKTNKKYYKEYYETNKNTILEKKKEKVTCKCGCVVTTQNIKRHKRTKKHTDFINPI
jgi:predicted glutamine amidotransferase